MVKTLLRSGNLNDFLALGENGQTIFDSAVQIRETLRLRGQHALANSLAIPQPDENGEKVDWYSPRSGSVTTWMAATLLQREQALRSLEKNLLTTEKLSRHCQLSDRSSIKLFGALLENVFRFPGCQYVYLVDGEPVITFWGFNALNVPVRENALDLLRDTLLPEPEPEPVDEPEVNAEPPLMQAPEAEDRFIDDPRPLIVTLSQPEKPPVAPLPDDLPPPEIVDEATPPPVPQPSGRKKTKRLLVLAAGIITAAVPAAWLVGAEHLTFAPVVSTADVTPPEPAVVAQVQPAPPKPTLNAELPLMQAKVSAPVVEEKLPTVTEVAVAEEPIPKDALVLPAASVKAGSTRFMNGNWRATIDYKDAIGGKPPVLRYQINNNAGTVRLTMGENITCRTEISSGLMQSGNLVIKPRGNARCSDGSRYTLPEVICTQGLTGAAQCTGRYNNDTVVPVAFRKVSK